MSEVNVSARFRSDFTYSFDWHCLLQCVFFSLSAFLSSGNEGNKDNDDKLGQSNTKQETGILPVRKHTQKILLSLKPENRG